jgi:hypothetical protein
MQVSQDSLYPRIVKKNKIFYMSLLLLLFACLSVIFKMDVNRKHNVYAGYVHKYKCKTRTYDAWRVEIVSNGKTYKKFFSFKSKNEELVALTNANKWRENKSDELKLTKPEIMPLSQIQPIPIAIQQYVGGFTDGDGCITMLSKTGKIMISFGQSSDTGVPNVLLFIQNLYGGKIYSQDPGGDRTKRRLCYRLHIAVREDVQRILPVLCTYCIIKKPQALVAESWLKTVPLGTRKVPSNDPVRVITYETLKTLKSMHEYVEVDEKDLNYHYLAGFVDAEGCVRMCGTVNLHIAQTSCVNMLNAIQQFLGFGSVSKCKRGYWCSADNAVKLIERLLPFSIVKKKQYKLALKWRKMQIATRTKGRTPRDPFDKKQLDQLAEKCARDKHPAQYKR